MRTTSNNWVERSKYGKVHVGGGYCQFLTVIITHSQAQLSTWESSIQNPANPAVLFFSFLFFLCYDLVWPLRDVLSFAILDRELYSSLPFFALQYKSNLTGRKNDLHGKIFTARSKTMSMLARCCISSSYCTSKNINFYLFNIFTWPSQKTTL